MKVLGFLFACLVGVGLYALMSEVDRLRCDRETDTCTVTQSGFRSEASTSFPARALRGAELSRVTTQRQRKGNAQRVVLLTSEGPVPLMGYATGVGIGGMEEIVAEVQTYVKNPRQRHLEVSRDNRLLALLVGFVPPGFAIAMTTLGRRPAART
jgi:hypothetical protein